MHTTNSAFISSGEKEVSVRFVYGSWYKVIAIRSDLDEYELASREEIMMTLANLNQILIKYVRSV